MSQIRPFSRLTHPRTVLTAAVITTVAVSVLAMGSRVPASATAQEPVQNVATRAVKPLVWTDTSGKEYGTETLTRHKATVFVFSNTECPLSGKYTPRILALQKEFATKGIAFFLVNSNAGDTREAFVQWAKERKYAFPLVKDNGTALADRLNASATPEAVVVDPTGNTVYIGRIDDNLELKQIRRNDLREALTDIVAGKPVRVARTRAFGCDIFRDKEPVKTAKKTTSRFTYAKDIAPLLDKNCVACHRKGDVGPFALDTYEQARLWSAAIKDYTARRIMPPWKAVPGHGEFHDARWLSDSELQQIAEWADGGTPPGNLKSIPPSTQTYSAGGWSLGTPDVVLKPVRPYHLEAEGEDVYRNFTLPLDFEADRYISAFDFKPGNAAIVHHMIAYIDTTGKSAAARDNKETEPGWSVSGGGSGIEDEDWGDGWAPGMTARRLAPGVAVRVPKGAKLVLQIHYHKTGKVEEDQSQVALYWAKEPVKKVMRTFPLSNYSFVLKPGTADQTVTASATIPVDMTLWQVLPHMHLLGKEMKATATLPDGTVKPLIWIQNWEFNWQMNYRYKEPIKLPKGTKVNLVAKYDNTAANPNQPNNPPREVRYGEQTTDEMCFLFMGLTRD
ncbi:MAG: thioredoxin family protein [Armatimonadaceae bacterium]